MRKRTIIRDVRNSLPDRAVDFAGRLGDGLRQAVPDGTGRWLHDAPHSAGQWLQGMRWGAGKWLQTGLALGAARTGARAAGTVARRHPVAWPPPPSASARRCMPSRRHRRNRTNAPLSKAARSGSATVSAGQDSADDGRRRHDTFSADLGLGAGRPDDVGSGDTSSRSDPGHVAAPGSGGRLASIEGRPLRQFHHEAGPAAFAVLVPQLAAGVHHDLARKRQAEAAG